MLMLINFELSNLGYLSEEASKKPKYANLKIRLTEPFDRSDLDFYPYRVNSTRSEMIDHSLIKRNKNDNVLKSFTVLTVRWLQMVIFLDTTGYYLLYLS